MNISFVNSKSDFDKSSLIELQSLCNPQAWSESLINQQLESGISIIYGENNELAGYLMARELSEDEIEIQDIGVSPKYRRMGVATKLIRALLNKFIKHNCLLEVRSRNISAINLYKSLGFKHEGNRYNYYSNPIDDALILKRARNTEKIAV